MSLTVGRRWHGRTEKKRQSTALNESQGQESSSPTVHFSLNNLYLSVIPRWELTTVSNFMEILLKELNVLFRLKLTFVFIRRL